MAKTCFYPSGFFEAVPAVRFIFSFFKEKRKRMPLPSGLKTVGQTIAPLFPRINYLCINYSIYE
jgi:hypothetical protein